MPSRTDIRGFIKQTLPDYGLCVLHYWWVVGFSFLIAVVGWVAQIFGTHVPGWLWVAVIILGVFIAQFLAWNDMRKERDRLHRYDVAQTTLTKLSVFRNDLISIQNEKLTSETELGAWRQRYFDKRNEIINYLSQNVSQAEANLFERLGNYLSVVIMEKNYVNQHEHVNLTAQVIRDHHWLERAIQDYSRKKFRPESEDHEYIARKILES